jgi:cytochrome c553
MPMSNFKVFPVVIFLCFNQFAEAAGDPARGEQKSTVCITCHGEAGRSTDPTIPIIRGQLAGYIIAATMEFTTGTRRNPQMDSILEVFDNSEDLQDIATYFASLPRVKGKPSGSDLEKEGEELFTRGRCNYCHFVDGKRFSPFQSDPPPPYITGQHKTYIIKAIHDIRDGRRPTDTYGLMREDVSKFSDHQIESIAEYLSGR